MSCGTDEDSSTSTLNSFKCLVWVGSELDEDKKKPDPIGDFNLYQVPQGVRGSATVPKSVFLASV